MTGWRFAKGWRWMRPSWTGGLPASGPGGFYVVLAIVALLLCHGAFGYAHQLPPADTPTAHVTHAAGGHQPGLDQDAEEVHLADAYFATLLALFFGTVLLLGGRRSAGAKLAVSTIRQHGHEVRTLPPPRGPTLFSLQVFRL